MHVPVLSTISSRFMCGIAFWLALPSGLCATHTVIDHFGPQSATVLVLAAAASHMQEDTSAVRALKQYAQELRQQAPDIHIIIAITQHENAQLPSNVLVKRLQGTKELIQTIQAYSKPIVCLIDTGETRNAKIIAGTKGITAPSWLLRAVYSALTYAQIPIDFYANTMLLHRLGWLDDDPALQLYNQAHIPSIKIATDADISAFFHHLADTLKSNSNTEWDAHYLTYKMGKKLIIISENQIVTILLFSIMGILFLLTVFSFIFGKKQVQHAKDFLVLWWMPLYFFCINSIALIGGSKIAELLLYLRLDSPTEIRLFSLLAIALKYSFALFVIFFLSSLNIIIPLPRNRFIYGFMANIACLINIFIFSSIHFSFSFIFLLIYFISLIAYQFKNSIIQLCFIPALFSPLIPFIVYILLFHQKVFDRIFFAHVEIALILVPVDLLLIRLVLSINKEKKGIITPFKFPLHCKVMGILFVLLAGLVFRLPVKRIKAQQPFMLVQKIQKNNAIFLKQYENASVKDRILPDDAIQCTSVPAAEVNNFLSVSSSVNNYFQRSTGTIAIHSSLKTEALAVTITAQHGSAFYDADVPFERNTKGDTVYITSIPQPAMPFFVHFSANPGAAFSVTVHLWSMDNPYRVSLKRPVPGASPSSFLLEIEKEFTVAAQADTQDG
ncbi:MAG: hypothetical protein ACTTJ7_08400 [Treponema sp.]